MNSQHKNPSYRNRVAVAPYNFVPLPEVILTVDQLPPHDRYDPALLTGKLTCTLTTASPLYVRAARTWDEYSHKDRDGKPDPITPSDPFYGETKETLLIPGSSLRGMLRNLVEVVSYSRIAPVTSQSLFFRTVDVSSIGKAYGKRMSGGDAGEQGWFTLSNAGYMELDPNGDYFIRPALELMGVQHYRIEEEIVLKALADLKNMAIKKDSGKWGPNKHYKWHRKKVWFKPVRPTSHLPESPTFFAEVSEIVFQDQTPLGEGWKLGWLMAGGWVPSPKGGRGKHRHWIVGPPNPDDSLRIPVKDDDIDLYKERTGGLTQKIRQEDKSILPSSEHREPIPCFYTTWTDEVGTQRLAFGHTGMFRLPYQKSPAEMLPDHLKSAQGIDLAEALFGFVDQKKSERPALAGRIFVTDAALKGNDPKTALLDMVTLSDQAMSGPKPTTIQHYLNQPNPDNPDLLKHYDSNPNTETALRGHKFYWHVGAGTDFEQRLKRAPQVDRQQRPDDKSNCFKPVKTDQAFIFEIYFENLHPVELGALIWVLEIAADPKYRLKLGMGKAYGFGSIALSFNISLDDRVKRYGAFLESSDWNLNEASKQTKLEDARNAFKQFILMHPDINPSKVISIAELPRIKELLALLSWGGRPAEEKTRYMELEEFTGRKHIFDGITGKASRRPVLPSATKVIDNPWFAALSMNAPRSENKDQTKSETPKLSAKNRTVPVQKKPTPPPKARVRPPEEARPQVVNRAPGELEPGDIIKVTVEDHAAPKSEANFLFDNIDPYEAFAFVPADKHPQYHYSKGKKVLLRVTSIQGDRTKGLQINCEPFD